VDGEPVLGAVSAPALGERYETVRGGGARWNGSPIRVSDVDSLEQAAVCHYATEEWLGTSRQAALFDLVRDTHRSVGFTDFWGHCLVARGSLEVMMEPSLRIWDWAALEVLVNEAGGLMTTFDGSPVADGTSVLTTNGRLHDEVVGRLA
jgi:histidinol-phosphatase